LINGLINNLFILVRGSFAEPCQAPGLAVIRQGSLCIENPLLVQIIRKAQGTLPPLLPQGMDIFFYIGSVFLVLDIYRNLVCTLKVRLIATQI
jgi:hypothetical protein